MTFAYPLVLLGLTAPILLIVWEATRVGHRLALPVDHTPAGSGRWLGRLVTAANFLPPLLLAAAILLLARPSVMGQPKRERVLTNVEFCLDVSGSMTAQFGEGTQYDAAMEAIKNFTSRRKGDAFGLTIFGNEVMRWVPLTKDLSAIRNATPFLSPDKLPRHFGGTEIGKGLLFCRETLIEQEKGDRLLILLSDGQSIDLGGSRAGEIGRKLADDDIMLYAIHIGDGQAPGQLYDVVRPTGGEVFAVENPAAMAAVFGHIDKMQPVRIKPAAPERIDRYTWFALGGLIVMGLHAMCLLGVRYTPW
jgi:Ca-activated chloride channel family protein